MVWETEYNPFIHLFHPSDLTTTDIDFKWQYLDWNLLYIDCAYAALLYKGILQNPKGMIRIIL